MKTKECKICGSRWHYQTFCPMKKKKLPNPFGKEYDRWVEFRDNTAIPYLDKNFGHKCRCCGTTKNLDVDHIHAKGSAPQLKYQLSNLQYLCRFPCHRNKTDEVECLHEED